MVAPFKASCLCTAQADQTLTENLLSYLDFPNDPCIKCMLKCYAKNVGILEQNGNVSTKELLINAAGLTPNQAKECVDLVKNIIDLCQKIYILSICVVESVSAAHNVTVPLPK